MFSWNLIAMARDMFYWASAFNLFKFHYDIANIWYPSNISNLVFGSVKIYVRDLFNCIVVIHFGTYINI